MTRDPARSDAHAFTRIELLISVVILGVISALTIPGLAGAAVSYRLELAVSRLKGDAVLCAEWARAAGVPHAMAFDPGASSYTVVAGADGSGAIRTSVDLSDGPYWCEISKISVSSGGHELAFDGSGRPPAGASVTLRVGGRSRTVVLSECAVGPEAPESQEGGRDH